MKAFEIQLFFFPLNSCLERYYRLGCGTEQGGYLGHDIIVSFRIFTARHWNWDCDSWTFLLTFVSSRVKKESNQILLFVVE